ncbi:MAG: hypothetical protein U0573_01660 [Phycisphaerales bacterium]|nr:hypothetical protein [Planctomycetota bacterium]
MSRVDTGISLPGTVEPPAAKDQRAVSELLAQAGDLAARTERANQPLGVVYLAGAVLALSILAAAYFAYDRVRASSRLDTEIARSNNIERLVQRLKEFDRINEERREEMKPLATLQTSITEAAVGAQLKTKLAPAQIINGRGTGDLVLRTWKYNDLHEDSIEHVLDWIGRCQRTVPGLELSGLTLRPDAQYWRIDVSFSRWERKGA